MGKQRIVKCLVVGLVLAGFGLPARAADEEVKIQQQWNGLYPVKKLELLPKNMRKTSLGYIGDARTFAAVWGAFKPGEKVPTVDFKDNLVVFTRNTQFLNSMQVAKVTKNDGKVSLLVIETRTSTPIEDQVHMAVIVIARKGVNKLNNFVTEIDVMDAN
jgi:hypothetical protein